MYVQYAMYIHHCQWFVIPYRDESLHGSALQTGTGMCSQMKMYTMCVTSILYTVIVYTYLKCSRV